MSIPDEFVDQMIASAKRASQRAYCPYSRFRVGAAVLTDEGEIFAGCNVENVSYGLTICAERNAIFQAVANTPGRIRLRALVVYTPTPTPMSPCGACRQVIAELGPDADLVSVCDGPEVLRWSIRELLPSKFGPDALEMTAKKREGVHGRKQHAVR